MGAPIDYVKFSREAVVYIDGEPISPFVRDSYVALVTFRDDHRVVVALEPGAAQDPQDHWIAAVKRAALMLRAADRESGFLSLSVD